MHLSTPSKFEAVAYYSTCSHEVKPVESGHRISLTFDITSAPKEIDSEELEDFGDKYGLKREPEEVEEEEFSEKLKKDFKEYLQTLKNNPSVPKKLGIILRYQYPWCSLCPSALKSGDREMYSLISELYGVTLKPLLWRFTSDEDTREMSVYLISPKITANPPIFPYELFGMEKEKKLSIINPYEGSLRLFHKNGYAMDSYQEDEERNSWYMSSAIVVDFLDCKFEQKD